MPVTKIQKIATKHQSRLSAPVTYINLCEPTKNLSCEFPCLGGSYYDYWQHVHFVVPKKYVVPKTFTPPSIYPNYENNM